MVFKAQHSLSATQLHTRHEKHIALLLTIYSSISLGDTELMEMFVQGKYILIGKGLDTDKTYFGEVKIKSVNNKLIVEREINKNQSKVRQLSGL